MLTRKANWLHRWTRFKFNRVRTTLRRQTMAGTDHGLHGSRIVNSLYSLTLLSTVMLPPCCCVTMS